MMMNTHQDIVSCNDLWLPNYNRIRGTHTPSNPAGIQSPLDFGTSFLSRQEQQNHAPVYNYPAPYSAFSMPLESSLHHYGFDDSSAALPASCESPNHAYQTRKESPKSWPVRSPLLDVSYGLKNFQDHMAPEHYDNELMEHQPNSNEPLHHFINMKPEPEQLELVMAQRPLTSPSLYDVLSGSQDPQTHASLGEVRPPAQPLTSELSFTGRSKTIAQVSPRRRSCWTEEEDAQLFEMVAHVGKIFDAPLPWAQVSALMPCRSASMCSKRYHALRDVQDGKRAKAMTRGAWTRQEDEDLVHCYEDYANSETGKIPWTKIGQSLKKPRTGLQTCARYTEALDSTVIRGRWTRSEDEILLEKWKLFGSRWAAISAFIEGRTQRQCASRFNVLYKRMSSAEIAEVSKHHQFQEEQSLAIRQVLLD